MLGQPRYTFEILFPSIDSHALTWDSNSLITFLLQVAVESKVNPHPMDLKIFGSRKHVEEEEVAPMIVEEARPIIFEDQSPSNVVAGVLSELAS